jgi:hypothetical protein
MLKKIVLGDGRTVEIDESRFNSFAALANYGSMITGVEGRDAGEAMAFIVSQLAYTESTVFERLYQPMQFEQLIPISHEAGEWADSIRYEIYDYAGRGKRHSGKGKDIPTVDIAFADKSFPVVNGAIGYDYTTEELRRSVYLRRPIPERKLAAAIDGYRRHMNDVGLYGEQNLTGLFNNTSVPHGNAPTGGWIALYNAATTADQQTAAVAKILADLNALIQGIWTTTQGNDQITDIVMPPLVYAFLGSTARSGNSDKTILQWLKENNIATMERGTVINFTAGWSLDTAGVGGVTRMMGYVKSDQRLVMHIPLALRFLAPQLVGLSVEVPGEYKYSGVEFRYPGSAYYMDGV